MAMMENPASVSEPYQPVDLQFCSLLEAKPCTSMTGGPLPIRSKAMRIPSVVVTNSDMSKPYRTTGGLSMMTRKNRNRLEIAANKDTKTDKANANTAHGLKARLSADMLSVFETGARYHMY